MLIYVIIADANKFSQRTFSHSKVENGTGKLVQRIIYLHPITLGPFFSRRHRTIFGPKKNGQPFGNKNLLIRLQH